MPTTYKVLGQIAPSASTNVSFYTCPSGTQTIVSTIVVCNRSSSSATFRIYLRPNNETLADRHYLCYDTPIPPNDSIFLTFGATMDAADQLYCFTTSANLSFSAFGSEIT